MAEEFITPSDAMALLNFFNDDNLSYTGEVSEETLIGQRPEEGEIEIYLENGLSLYVTFDNEKILVEVIDAGKVFIAQKNIDN